MCSFFEVVAATLPADREVLPYCLARTSRSTSAFRSMICLARPSESKLDSAVEGITTIHRRNGGQNKFQESGQFQSFGCDLPPNHTAFCKEHICAFALLVVENRFIESSVPAGRPGGVVAGPDLRSA